VQQVQLVHRVFRDQLERRDRLALKVLRVFKALLVLLVQLEAQVLLAQLDRQAHKEFKEQLALLEQRV
jgi:hypothetical protein